MNEAMGSNNKPVTRWLLIAGHLMIIMFMLACTAIAVKPSDAAPQGTIDIDDDLIKMVDGNGEWVPIAGESTFELTAELERRLPWTVASQTLETIDTTQIEEGLQVGDLVRVRGTILNDGIWLAYSIEHAEEQTDLIVNLIGKVNSIAPWIVSGITLHATDETDFQGDIRRGMLVRVEILSDSTWEMLSMAPLHDFKEIEDCVTVLATIMVLNGNQIQFLGWPNLTLAENTQIENSEDNENGDEDKNDNEEDVERTLQPDQEALVVICPAGDDQIMISQIIVLN